MSTPKEMSEFRDIARKEQAENPPPPLTAKQRDRLATLLKKPTRAAK